MSYSNGPRIVTNGLVLCLDAGNSKSYPGSGTVWNDLSGNNNHGTLINSPTYSSSNKGSIVFDGTNDYVDLGTSDVFNRTSDLTICSWIFPIGYGGGGLGRIIHRGTINTGGYGFYLNQSASGIRWQIGRSTGGVTIDANNSVSLNSWQFFAVSFSNTTTTIYKNNSTILTVASTPATSLITNTAIGNRNDSPYDRGFNGYISNVLFFNTVLSAAQILQNYNALKGRYNL